MSSKSNSLILLTGGSGFVGSSIALEALRRGYSVRLALRKRSQFDDWLGKYPEWKGKLSYVLVEDFVKKGAFDEAVKGVDFVCHTATPVDFAPKDAKRDVIDPAIDGIKSILASAKGSPSIKSFIYTSTINTYCDVTNPPKEVLTEKDWAFFTYEESCTLPSDKGMLIYSASKTLAEKAAWEFMKTKKPSFTFTTLAPAYVLGYNPQPNLTWKNAKQASTWGWTAQLLDHTEGPPSDAPAVYVNSHDVAVAHVLALTSPQAANKRYLLVGGPLSYPEMVDIARKVNPEQASRWSVPEEAKQQREPKFDASAAERDLGFKYIGAEQTVKSFVEQIFALPGAVPSSA
ncbi:hypothetical protein BCR35DRAFT_327635 [Leucosporidium creatinivorum]|uniref:3-beta hydroxysteroid dehydrogenase/isomerase domain-containing protein n=1 Tax=Leucosporidium creatinivorum TaxID=106004 RepID=A0A1Y2G617_9BASI|nr:hypothetical protein BCR35DRAFT_327635 [Leucosporidium creatinivorum]